jgi:cell division protein FtsI (penicillin-binding protein 3)
MALLRRRQKTARDPGPLAGQSPAVPDRDADGTRARNRRKPAVPSREVWLRRTRARLLVVVLAPIALLVASGSVAGYLQIARHVVYDAVAKSNYQRHIVLDDTRGQVVDRNGGLLASSVDVDSVWVDPAQVEDPRLTAERVGETLGLPVAEVYEKVTRAGKRFVYLKRRISARESRRVRSLGLPGIHLQRDRERFYPKKELAGQVLGIVGWEHQGLEGIELAYDAELRGQSARIPVLRDKLKRTSFAKDIPAIPRFAGHTVVLSIDERIQEHAELVLERAVITARALSGMALVLDVTTGDVLAVAHVPRFNPNTYNEFGYERRRNRAVGDVFEPGSTFKVFTLAAALETGVIQMDDVLDVEGGHYRIGPHTIHDTHPYGALDVWDIVKHSSNIGFAKMGELLGKDLLHDYLVAFGFGERPGTGLPGEAEGHLRPTKDWAAVTFANICFGQGVTVSALQIVRAMGAIANGGELMRPILVREIRDSNGTVLFRAVPRRERQVVSPETAATVMTAMARVVEDGGTGVQGRSQRFSVVGKTGTAQKPDHLIGGYSPHAWVGSFLGAAPLEDPRIAVLVVIDEPIGKAYGGVVAAPAFREIVDWTLDYLGVPPTVATVHRGARIRQGAGLATTRRDAALESTSGDGTGGLGAAAVEAPPAEGVPGDATDAAAEVFVPDFRGLSLAKARDLAAEVRVDLLLRGAGVAVEQSPLPGVRLPAWSSVEVVFGPRPEAPAESPEAGKD